LAVGSEGAGIRYYVKGLSGLAKLTHPPQADRLTHYSLSSIKKSKIKRSKNQRSEI
jgi:hypothetical protein